MLDYAPERSEHLVRRSPGVAVEIAAEREHREQYWEVAEDVIHIHRDQTREFAGKGLEEIFQVFRSLRLFLDALALELVVEQLEFSAKNFQIILTIAYACGDRNQVVAVIVVYLFQLSHTGNSFLSPF